MTNNEIITALCSEYGEDAGMCLFEELKRAYGENVSAVFNTVNEALEDDDNDIEDIKIATQQQLPELVASGYKVVGTFRPNHQKMH